MVEIYLWREVILFYTVFYSRRVLYFILPLGSPIRPVAPPIMKMGLRPMRLSLVIMRMETRFPRWRESEVGS